MLMQAAESAIRAFITWVILLSVYYHNLIA